MKVSTVTAAAISQVCDERTLRDLRGVGKSIEEDLNALGIYNIHDLARTKGIVLYLALNKLKGVRQDPCVLDTFTCAVAQARNPDLPLEQKNWWWWSRRRKQAELAMPSFKKPIQSRSPLIMEPRQNPSDP